MNPSDLRAELAERLANSTPIDAETFNAACFMLTRALDTAAADSSLETWPNTQEMALQWIDEALRGLGYEARPIS
jgi:hypothetical protein